MPKLTPDMTNDQVALAVEVVDRSNYICDLYRRFATELGPVRDAQREFYRSGLRNLWPQFDDVEGELLYLFMLDLRPGIVVEVSPGVGWSTSWLLHGLCHTGCGMLTSCDIDNVSTRTIPEYLRRCWHFVHGDFWAHLDEFPDQIDFLLMDSDHNEPFVSNFMAEMFPRVRSGGRICVHDVFALATPAHGEAVAAFRYMDERDIQCYTPSHCFPGPHAAIQATRRELGFSEPIHTSPVNSLLIFDVP